MAISYVTSGSASQTFAAGYSISGVNLSGSNLLIVGVICQYGPIYGVTYGGTPLTLITTGNDSGNSATSCTYYLPLPATGSNNLVVIAGTTSAGGYNNGIMDITYAGFSGCATSSSIGVSNSSFHNTVLSPTITLSGVSGTTSHLVLFEGQFYSLSGSSITATGILTQRTYTTESATPSEAFILSGASNSSGTVTLGYTGTNGAAQADLHAFEILPPATGAQTLTLNPVIETINIGRPAVSIFGTGTIALVSSGSASLTFSGGYTIPSLNLSSATVLVVNIAWQYGSEIISGITYGSAALTQITTGNNSVVGYSSASYYLVNPASGANTLTITTAINNDDVGLIEVSYAGLTGATTASLPIGSYTKSSAVSYPNPSIVVNQVAASNSYLLLSEFGFYSLSDSTTTGISPLTFLTKSSALLEGSTNNYGEAKLFGGTSGSSGSVTLGFNSSGGQNLFLTGIEILPGFNTNTITVTSGPTATFTIGTISLGVLYTGPRAVQYAQTYHPTISGTSWTVPAITLGANTSLLVVFIDVSQAAYGPLTSVTFGGVALTQVTGTYSINSGDGGGSGYWYLVSPASAASSLIITCPTQMSTASPVLTVATIGFTGANPSTLFGAYNAIANSSTSITGNLNGIAGPSSYILASNFSLYASSGTNTLTPNTYTQLTAFGSTGTPNAGELFVYGLSNPSSSSSLTIASSNIYYQEIKMLEVEGIPVNSLAVVGPTATFAVGAISLVEGLAIQLISVPLTATLGPIVLIYPQTVAVGTPTSTFTIGTITLGIVQVLALATGPIATFSVGTVAITNATPSTLTINPLSATFNIGTISLTLAQAPGAPGTITVNPLTIAIALQPIVVGTIYIANFNLTLNNPAVFTGYVNWTTQDGTAVSPANYIGNSGVLAFPPGTTTQAIKIFVPISGLGSTTKNFSIVLSNPIELTISGSNTAIATLPIQPIIVGISNAIITTS